MPDCGKTIVATPPVILTSPTFSAHATGLPRCGVPWTERTKSASTRTCATSGLSGRSGSTPSMKISSSSLNIPGSAEQATYATSPSRLKSGDDRSVVLPAVLAIFSILGSIVSGSDRLAFYREPWTIPASTSAVTVSAIVVQYVNQPQTEAEREAIRGIVGRGQPYGVGPSYGNAARFSTRCSGSAVGRETSQNMCICKTQLTIMRGVSINGLPNLKCSLRETRIDGMTWQTWYRCNECGQEWLERYVATGHGEIPEVVKLTAGGQMVKRWREPFFRSV